MEGIHVDYEKADKEIIPAARLFIATVLKKRYNMTEQDIADRLGVAQAAVSKYLNGKSSARIAEIKETIMKDERFNYYIEMIHEKKEHYVELCICTICRVLTDAECRFSYADKIAKG